MDGWRPGTTTHGKKLTHGSQETRAAAGTPPGRNRRVRLATTTPQLAPVGKATDATPPQQSDGYSTGSYSGRAAAYPRKGDWVCDHCGAVNFASKKRTVC